MDTWGTLGVQWGINKTMAQIHALLLIAAEPINADQIISELHISQGNANMNIRALIEWDLVRKIQKTGMRCDYFVAEKDIHIVFKTILERRKQKELDPLIEELKNLEILPSMRRRQKEFSEMLGNITDFVLKANTALDTLIKADSHWFFQHTP
ncbi:MAG: transcriptional regulator [Saprospiraceae bacterium]|nr:transcriptional regulator [Saprospiraceae bacterium]